MLRWQLPCILFEAARQKRHGFGRIGDSGNCLAFVALRCVKYYYGGCLIDVIATRCMMPCSKILSDCHFYSAVSATCWHET